MLSLGIGATTAMFSVVDGVLVRTPPYRDPAALVTIWQTFPHWRGQPVLDASWNRIALSYREYRDIAALQGVFRETAAAYWRPDVQLSGHGAPLEVPVARGSATLLPLLGLTVEAGRWFLPGEEGPGAPPIAVLSHALWVQEFGASRSAIGQTIDLDGRPFTVVGVLPAEFPFVSLSPFASPVDRTAIWTPIGSWPSDLVEHSQNYEVVARLEPGVSVAHARDVAAVAIRAGRSPAQHDAAVLPRQAAETASVSTPLTALLAAALALLLITCANVTALLLGEGAARESEMQTRMALGATAGRLVRVLLAENALVVTVGGVGGVALAAGLTQILVSLAPLAVPHASQIALNGRVLVAALVTTGVVAMGVGIVPALSLASTGEVRDMRHRVVTARRSTLQHGLIVAQIALSGMLLLVSGLLDRTLAIEHGTAPGFATTNLLTVSLKGASSSAGPQSRYDAIVERLTRLPGVVRVTATSNIPIAGPGSEWSFSPDPATKLTLMSPSVQHDEVRPGFFEMLQISVLAGRTLRETDRTSTPLVAVVNETMARTFWPTTRAVGQAFLAPNGGVRTIVGIVADIHERGLGQRPVPTFYESVNQVPTSAQTLVVETAVDPVALAASIRQAIWDVAPDQPIGSVRTMADVLSASLAPDRYRAALVAFFALVAAVVTAIGIAGAAMRAMAAERREHCIRMALGSTPESVARLIVRRYLRVAGLGLACGALGSVVALRFVATYLVGVTTHDPVTIGAVGIAVLVMVAMAAWFPTRGLSRTNLVRELAGN